MVVAHTSAPAVFPEIDRLKALSMVCVVAIHSLRPFTHPQGSALERVLAVVTQFAVPCFLFCSGFLYARPDPRPGRTVIARLGRLLPAYAVAALLAGWFRTRWLQEPVVWVRDLLLGHTFGAYYYVFVLVTLVLATPLIAALPNPLRWLVSAFLIVSGSLRSVAPLLELSPATTGRLNVGLDPNFPWHLRHPLLVWGYFFCGWEVRAGLPWLRAKVLGRPWPRRLVALSLSLSFAFVVAASLRGDVLGLMLISWPLIYLTLGGLVLATFTRTRARPFELWLSQRSYFVYLYHLFFVITAQRLWPQPRTGVSYGMLLGYFACGVIGPVLLAWALDRVLPSSWLRLLGLNRHQNVVSGEHA